MELEETAQNKVFCFIYIPDFSLIISFVGWVAFFYVNTFVSTSLLTFRLSLFLQCLNVTIPVMDSKGHQTIIAVTWGSVHGAQYDSKSHTFRRADATERRLNSSG